MRRKSTLPHVRSGRHTLAVFMVTVALIVAAIATLPSLTDRLSTGGWIPPDSEAVIVDERLASEFNRRATSHLVLLTPVDPEVGLDGVMARQELARITQQLRSIPGVTGVYSPINAPTAAMRSSLVSQDGSEWLVIIQVEQDLQATIAQLPEIEATIESDLLATSTTGVPALSSEFARQVESDLLRAELIALPIAMLCLIRFAAAWRAAIAILLTTLTSLAATMVLVAIASNVVTISIFALSTAAMLSIALSLDYGLLHALRHSERDSERHTQSTITIATLAVIAGMAGIALLPVDAARSIGIVGAIGVGMVLLCQRLVLPIWFELLGDTTRKPSVTAVTPNQWLAIVGRHPIPSLLLGVIILIPLLAPVTSMRVVGPDVGLLPESSPAARTLDEVTNSFPMITASPISIIASPIDGSMLDAGNLFSLKQTEERLARLPGVESVTSVWDLVPGGISSPVLTASLALDPTLVEQAQPMLTERGAVIEVVASPDPQIRAELVDILRSNEVRLSEGELRFHIGGTDAASVDLLASIEEIVVPAIALVVLATLVVLMVAFRSIVLPVKAVLLNAIPVLAGLGVVTWLFQLGTPWNGGAGTTVIIVPMILAWLMYGVSMDYEVFILTRIREYRQRGFTNLEATLSGVESARAVVSRGAMLMGIVFLAFSTSDVLVVRAIGIGLLVAIVVDATIVRLVLLPASMVLLGKWNWWWPHWLPALAPADGSYLREQRAAGDGG